MELKYKCNEREYLLSYITDKSKANLSIDGTTYITDFEFLSSNSLSLIINGEHFIVYYQIEENCYNLNINGNRLKIFTGESTKYLSKSQSENLKHQTIMSQMPGNIVKMNVKIGDFVKAGETICIIESMKMETSLKAEISGIVEKVHCKEGQVKPFVPIVEIIANY